MKVKLITATVRTFPVMDGGKKDRRFKSGYRVMPVFSHIGYELKLRLDNPHNQFRMNEVVITPFGKFMITHTFNSEYKWIDLTQLEAIRRYNEPLVFDAEIDIASGGFMYIGEGSNP